MDDRVDGVICPGMHDQEPTTCSEWLHWIITNYDHDTISRLLASPSMIDCLYAPFEASCLPGVKFVWMIGMEDWMEEHRRCSKVNDRLFVESEMRWSPMQCDWMNMARRKWQTLHNKTIQPAAHYCADTHELFPVFRSWIYSLIGDKHFKTHPYRQITTWFEPKFPSSCRKQPRKKHPTQASNKFSLYPISDLAMPCHSSNTQYWVRIRESTTILKATITS